MHTELYSGTSRLSSSQGSSYQVHLKVTITNFKWLLVQPAHPTAFPWWIYSPALLHNNSLHPSNPKHLFLPHSQLIILLILPRKYKQQQKTSTFLYPNPPPSLHVCPPFCRCGCAVQQVTSPYLWLRLTSTWMPRYHSFLPIWGHQSYNVLSLIPCFLLYWIILINL